MIKKLTTLLSLILLGAIIPVFVNAQDLISVQFIPDPLIYAINFLPGDTVSGQIKVDNISGQIVNLYMWTTDVSDIDHLGDVLELKISQGQNTVYQDTLSQLFAENSVFLLDLNPQENQNFDFSLTFDISAGNEYQNKALGFNFHIGTEENVEENENDQGSGGGSTPIIISGGGGGTGSGGANPKLEIINLRAEEITETKVTIKWQTNLPATTQIIYSSQHQPHNFLPNNPLLYGYQNIFPEPEDSAKIIFHTLILENLTPCTTYYYRAISHNSSIAISEEKSFQTVCPQGEGLTEETGSQGNNFPTGKTEPVSPVSQPKTNPPLEVTPSLQEPTTQSPNSNESPQLLSQTLPVETSQGGDNRIQPGFLSLLLASINNTLNLKGLGCSPWWAILFLILYSLFKTFLSFSRSRNQLREGNDFLKKRYRIHTIIWLAWAIILFLIMLILMKICVNLLVLIFLLLVTALLFLRLKEVRNTQKNQQKTVESYPQFVKP